MEAIKQVLLAVVLIGLIGAVVAFRYYYRTPDESNVSETDAVKRYGFALRNQLTLLAYAEVLRAVVLDRK